MGTLVFNPYDLNHGKRLKKIKTKKLRKDYEKSIPNNKMGSTYIPFPQSFIKKYINRKRINK